MPWHCLNFLPEPHGQGSLRPTTAAPLEATFAAAGLGGAEGRRRDAGAGRGGGWGGAAAGGGLEVAVEVLAAAGLAASAVTSPVGSAGVAWG